jgi:hypothetical protein
MSTAGRFPLVSEMIQNLKFTQKGMRGITIKEESLSSNTKVLKCLRWENSESNQVQYENHIIWHLLDCSCTAGWKDELFPHLSEVGK